jgi:tetratricopeptide (TPR) repeat protein
LPVPVEVTVGKLPPVQVAAGRRAAVTSPVGTQPVVVRHGKHVVESGSLNVKRGADAVLWNVLGAGFVYREEVHYGDAGASKAANHVPTVWCGQSGIVVDSVDDLFATPPRTMSTRKSSAPPVRVHIDLYADEDVTCPLYLVGANRGPEAIRLASAVAEAADFSPAPTELAVEIMQRRADPEQALAFLAKALKEHDGSVELHRMRQSALILAGRRQDAVTLYQQRAAAHPDSGDDAYLSARVLSGPKALAAVTEAQARFPDHPFLLRSLLFVSVHAGDYRKAVGAAEKLRKLDRTHWTEVVALHAQALVGDGKLGQARAVVDGALAAGVPQGHRRELLTLALQLAVADPAATRASSQASVAAILKTLGDATEQEGLRRRLAAQLAAGLAMTEDDLAKLADGPAKTSLRLGLLARKRPAEAVAQLARLDPAKLGQLPVLPWTLLAGEAARVESGKAALAVLTPLSPFGPWIAQAMAGYVRTGAGAEVIEELPLDVVAALHFARSRALQGRERAELEARARREDLLHGPVFQAMAEWPR